MNFHNFEFGNILDQMYETKMTKLNNHHLKCSSVKSFDTAGVTFLGAKDTGTALRFNNEINNFFVFNSIRNELLAA